MSSNIATYDRGFGTPPESDSTSGVAWTSDSGSENIKEIKTEIVLSINDFELSDGNSKPLIYYGFAYYPYSLSVSVVLAVMGLILLITFFNGIHTHLFIAAWILFIGLGMARTLIIAGNERHMSNGKN